MIPSGIVATLRTTEIVIAYLANIVITHSIPKLPNMFGAIVILFAAVALIFEKKISEKISSTLFCHKNNESNVSYSLINEQDDLLRIKS